jgi:hypothetical protein
MENVKWRMQDQDYGCMLTAVCLPIVKSQQLKAEGIRQMGKEENVRREGEKTGK